MTHVLPRGGEPLPDYDVAGGSQAGACSVRPYAVTIVDAHKYSPCVCGRQGSTRDRFKKHVDVRVAGALMPAECRFRPVRDKQKTSLAVSTARCRMPRNARERRYSTRLLLLAHHLAHNDLQFSAWSLIRQNATLWLPRALYHLAPHGIEKRITRQEMR